MLCYACGAFLYRYFSRHGSPAGATAARRSPPWRKMQMLAGLNASARNLALTGLRQRLPHASEAELNRRLAYLLLGPDLARKALGEVEDAA